MINSTVLRSNFDVCRWKNLDTSSSVDLKSIHLQCEMRTGLTRIAMRSCMLFVSTSLAVVLKDISGCGGW